MNKFTYKIATGLATGAVLASVIAPAAFAATDVTVQGNGHKSDNTVKVKNVQKNTVSQSNTSAVINVTAVLQNTGGNKANGNTGGNTGITTGNTKSTVTNTTMTGGNVAHVDSCGCADSDTVVTVKKNGSKSDNKVTVKNKNVSTVSQSNEAFVMNGTLVGQNTGMNKANHNTDGDVSVSTGNTHSDVTNDVTTGSNELNP